MEITTRDQRANPVLLGANIAFVWPAALAGVGLVAGGAAAAIIPVVNGSGTWQDIPTMLPAALFYGAATGALFGVFITIVAGILAVRYSGDCYVCALRQTGMLVVAALFLAAAVVFNDSFPDRVAFVRLYGLPMVLGTWLGWWVVPAVVRSYEHRMK